MVHCDRCPKAQKKSLKLKTDTLHLKPKASPPSTRLFVVASWVLKNMRCNYCPSLHPFVKPKSEKCEIEQFIHVLCSILARLCSIFLPLPRE